MIEPPRRDYDPLFLDIPADAPRIDRMRAVVDAIWSAFRAREAGDRGVSWVGFYLAPGQALDGDTARPDEMILAVREPKPACSPIGLHGACGKCFLTHTPLVVTDVRALGEHYVACDPRDQSELVVPCIGEDGACFAVLDLDSFDLDAFSIDDARGLHGVLTAAGLCAPAHVPGEPAVY